MPSSTPSPSYRVAAEAIPYALPITIGLACLGWSAVELLSKFTRQWVFVELLPALSVLSVGTGLILFGSIGAISHTLQPNELSSEN